MAAADVSQQGTASLPPLETPTQRPVEKRPEDAVRVIGKGYVGNPVPEFTLRTVDGRTCSTSRIPCRVLIIELWGLNCGSCLEEMRELEPLYQEFRDRGLGIWSINAEDATAEAIQAGLKKKGIHVSYDLLVDPGLQATRLFTTWFIPVTVMVDTSGTVQYYKVGFGVKDVQTMRTRVEELLK